MRMSTEEFLRLHPEMAAEVRKGMAPAAPAAASLAGEQERTTLIEKLGKRGRGRRTHAKGEMNETERKYAQHLDQRKLAGEILWYSFESVVLNLAYRCTYTVDFFVMLANGDFEAHEVKGFWEDDARVKVKVAARMFPIYFLSVRREKGAWVYSEVKP